MYRDDYFITEVERRGRKRKERGGEEGDKWSERKEEEEEKIGCWVEVD